MNSTWKDKLKKAWNENPMAVIAVGTGAAIAAAKVLDTLSAMQSRRAYARQVEFRTRYPKGM
jgi:alcohol dehydrogenase class IV